MQEPEREGAVLICLSAENKQRRESVVPERYGSMKRPFFARLLLQMAGRLRLTVAYCTRAFPDCAFKLSNILAEKLVTFECPFQIFEEQIVISGHARRKAVIDPIAGTAIQD